MKNIFRDWILRFEEKGEFSLEPVKLWGFMPFFFLMAIPEKSSRVKVQGAKVPLPLKFISSKLEKKNEEKYGGFLRSLHFTVEFLWTWLNFLAGVAIDTKPNEKTLATSNNTCIS